MAKKHPVHTIDATGRTIGRVATEVAVLLRGKHKATFAPHIDNGDAVVVRNLAGVRFTGSKLDTTMTYSHSGWPGALRTRSLREQWGRNPEHVLREAVRRMLPDNRLRDGMLKRLTVV